MPEFRGVVLDSAGSAVASATVDLYDADTTTPSRANTTTDASGLWAISHSTLGRFDVKIVNGTETVWLRARDRYQVDMMQADSATTALAAVTGTSSTDEASTLVAIFEGNRATPADGDDAYISLKLSDDAGNQDEQARITWEATTVASGATQDGDLFFSTLTNGVLTEYLRIDGSAPQITLPAATPVFVNESANANMTVGITVNQAANDDEILALKSSDVAHGMTSVTETDTYGVLKKHSAGDGGLGVLGYSDASQGFVAIGAGATEDTTDTTTSNSAVEVQGQLKSGTGVTALGATGNVFTVDNGGGSVLFLLKGNGDIHAVDTDGNTALDAFDDVQLVRALETHSNRDGVIKDEWDNFVKYNEQDLIDAGLYTVPRSKGGLLNVSQLLRLQNGAIWQLGKRLMAAEQKLAALPQP